MLKTFSDRSSPTNAKIYPKLVFSPEKQPIEMTGDEHLPVPEFLQLDITVTQVFQWLKPTKN